MQRSRFGSSSAAPDEVEDSMKTLEEKTDKDIINSVWKSKHLIFLPSKIQDNNSEAVAAEEPWYGIEQEYTLIQKNVNWHLG
ncbi:hypothetical protein SASPL_113888 [Salvia splendens]|uniref:Uncharacterized protein n=1 Tax=Salvia splendens TaxID=180675 RepID=A0A8X8ZZW6_SALSN|nr:hypothetical protein SASPL_113888 [Salvia splendens]